MTVGKYLHNIVDELLPEFKVPTRTFPFHDSKPGSRMGAMVRKILYQYSHPNIVHTVVNKTTSSIIAVETLNLRERSLFMVGILVHVYRIDSSPCAARLGLYAKQLMLDDAREPESRP